MIKEWIINFFNFFFKVEKLKNQINAYKEEISVLRKLVHRLNIELSKYQSTYPSKSIKSTLSKVKLIFIFECIFILK